MLQDRAHTITAAQRLEQKRSGLLVFFPFSVPTPTLPRSKVWGGRGHDDTKLLYIDTKCVCLTASPPGPSTHHRNFTLSRPGEHHAEHRSLAARPLGGPGDAPASVTGASLGDQWSPPHKALLVNGVHTDLWVPSPPPTRLFDAQQAFAAASHTHCICVLAAHPNAGLGWTLRQRRLKGLIDTNDGATLNDDGGPWDAHFAMCVRTDGRTDRRTDVRACDALRCHAHAMPMPSMLCQAATSYLLLLRIASTIS